MPKRERAVAMAMKGRILEEMMPRVNVASKVFINKVFIILKDNNNQQSSRDIFMNEGEDEVEEEEVSSFDSLLFNNNEPPSTKRLSWWWFTKDVLRRTTEGGTQLDEEDNDKDEEGAEEVEAEWRNTNSEIKVRVRGGSLVEERDREEPVKERTTRAHISFHFFFMCPVASEGSNSLVAVSLEER